MPPKGDRLREREILVNLEETEKLQREIWKEIAGLNLSVSHDRWHIDRVLHFACQLQSTYGGDLEVIIAAVLMHDLGRGTPSLHGQESIAQSVAHARKVLAQIDFPPDKVEPVITAISEHDQPELRPSTIEGRILKDADFLGGFGPWGILRIGLWAGETGGGVDQILDRLGHRMPRRLANLTFPESMRLAKEEMMFSHLFLSRLNAPPRLPTPSWKGKYIVLEGISGSGKDSQAERLQERLKACGRPDLTVHEPGDVYKGMCDAWKTRYKAALADPTMMTFFLMADRYNMMQSKVRPALEKGDIVISVRSFISTLVYQCSSPDEAAAMAFAHGFVPFPDLIVLLDLDAEVALTRLKDRENRGMHETKRLLVKHRERYRDVCNRFFKPWLQVIDASRPMEKVAEQTWESVERILRNDAALCYRFP